MRTLTAIPVFNEVKTIEGVLNEVRRYCPDLLVVDDGSTDGTSELLATQSDLILVKHPVNRGYGAALISAFARFVASDYDMLVTMDCDGQHEPSRIPVLLEALDSNTDIVSGSRYLRDFRQTTLPTPQDRKQINQIITSELNDAFGLNLTDAFCGFKAYRKDAIARLSITENGWGMPLQLFVQAAKRGLTIREVGVPRIYLDPNRSFGNGLDDSEKRLAYYRRVIEDALAEESRAWCRLTCHA
jgi:glycosyltransferase involved in cell wall biosynthesis